MDLNLFKLEPCGCFPQLLHNMNRCIVWCQRPHVDSTASLPGGAVQRLSEQEKGQGIRKSQRVSLHPSSSCACKGEAGIWKLRSVHQCGSET